MNLRILPAVTTLSLAMVVTCSQPRADASDQRYAGEHLGDTVQPHPWCVKGGVGTGAVLRLTSDSFGPITPSRRKAELRHLCPGLRDSVWEGAEGIPQIATIFEVQGQHVGLIEWFGPDGALSRLLITSSFARTRDSLGVGTTVGILRRHLGRLSAGYDDAGVYVWSEAQPRISYLLRFRVTSVLRVPDDISQRPEVVPDTARVQTVLFAARE